MSKNSNCTIYPITGDTKRFISFLTSLKVNVMAWLELELAYCDITVQLVNYILLDCPRLLWISINYFQDWLVTIVREPSWLYNLSIFAREEGFMPFLRALLKMKPKQPLSKLEHASAISLSVLHLPGALHFLRQMSFCKQTYFRNHFKQVNHLKFNPIAGRDTFLLLTVYS